MEGRLDDDDVCTGLRQQLDAADDGDVLVYAGVIETDEVCTPSSNDSTPPRSGND
jgi:hypothetical protein